MSQTHNVTRRGLFQWASVAASALGLMLFTKKAEAIDIPAPIADLSKLTYQEQREQRGSPGARAFIKGNPHRQVTTWHPDTCKCILEYGWDDRQAQEDRMHIPLPPVRVCEKHQFDADPFMSAAFDNRQKNGMPEHLLAAGFTRSTDDLA